MNGKQERRQHLDLPEFIAEADVNVTLEPQERNENQQFGLLVPAGCEDRRDSKE